MQPLPSCNPKGWTWPEGAHIAIQQSVLVSPIIRVTATSAALVMASTWTTPPTEHGVVCAADAPHNVTPPALGDYSMIELQGNPAVWNGDRPAVPQCVTQ